MPATRRRRVSKDKSDAGEAANPDMPVGTAIHEARLLWDAVSARRARFAGLPDVLELLDALPGLASALEEHERAWMAVDATVKRGSLRVPRQEALQLRAVFLRAARFLLRHDEEAQRSLDRIAKGSALDRLCGDMDRIGILAAKHAAVLALDPALPDDIPAHAESIAMMLAWIPDNAVRLRARRARNEAFRTLDETVKQVRAAGRYVLRDDPEALAQMASAYKAEKNRRRRVRLREKAGQQLVAQTSE